MIKRAIWFLIRPTVHLFATIGLEEVSREQLARGDARRRL